MSKRIIVKVGSNPLVSEGGAVQYQVLNLIAAQIARGRTLGFQFVVVTSGATLAGLRKAPCLQSVANLVVQTQIAAFVGQATIARAWEESFGRLGITAGQMLRTHADFANGSVTSLLEQILAQGFVPIINEDDTRSPEEARAYVKDRGDNDQLACRVAWAIRAERVFLLTDVDGVYDRNQSGELGREPIPVIERVDDAIRSMVCDGASGRPTGMRSKLAAADILQTFGITAHIAHAGKEVIVPILEGKQIGTTFPARH